MTHSSWKPNDEKDAEEELVERPEEDEDAQAASGAEERFLDYVEEATLSQGRDSQGEDTSSSPAARGHKNLEGCDGR